MSYTPKCTFVTKSKDERRALRQRFSKDVKKTIKKYSLTPGIKCVRLNFIFLNDGTMWYDHSKFDDYFDAMVDSIIQGEDLNDMIALTHPCKRDHIPVGTCIKQELIKLIKSI